MNTADVDTASRVTAAMDAAERSRKWTAMKSGIADSTFARKLTGSTGFTVGELYRIATALSVPVSDLLPVEVFESAVA